MDLPLRLGWLGKETAEICAQIAPYHPLILISPAPRNLEALPGLTLLPGGVSRVLDMRDPNVSEHSELAQNDWLKDRGLRINVIELTYNTRELSEIYDFYLELYLRMTSLSYLDSTTRYSYIENLHHLTIKQDFIAFAQVLLGDEVIAGGLLRRPSTEEQLDYDQFLGYSTPDGHSPVVVLELLCVDARFQNSGLEKLTVLELARWAQGANYSLLTTASVSALTVLNANFETGWTLRAGMSPVFHDSSSSLLYCDLDRCSRLTHDIYFYSMQGDALALCYVANVSPCSSHLYELLNSTDGVEKKIYTRHRQVQEALSRTDAECIRIA